MHIYKFYLYLIIFTLYLTSCSEDMTVAQCEEKGGRVLNTLSRQDKANMCKQTEENIGKISEYKCPCICCKSRQILNLE